ncbi:MAG: hypothetical protein JRG96_07710 [Deltaproteobacteria bacterium]|nr:hypothetical protein [Deltaproteobacteria bacterium]MBW2417989.1 hypothetical protein [Deltaproteobacteria bacterium]
MPAEVIPLHPRFNPLSEKDHRHYEELLRRVNFSDAVVRHLMRNLSELERQFIEDDLVVKSGPREGEPLDAEGREQRLLELMRINLDHARAREEHLKLIEQLGKIEQVIDDWAAHFDN